MTKQNTMDEKMRKILEEMACYKCREVSGSGYEVRIKRAITALKSWFVDELKKMKKDYREYDSLLKPKTSEREHGFNSAINIIAKKFEE